MSRRWSARPGAWQATGRAQQRWVEMPRRISTPTILDGEAEIEPALRHDGRKVGAFVRGGDGQVLLRKKVDPPKHQLRQPPAWAVAAAHWLRLLELGGAGVELIDAAGRRWWAPIEAFTRHALRIQRDVDEQLALPLRYWHADGPDGRQLPLFSEPLDGNGGAK